MSSQTTTSPVQTPPDVATGSALVASPAASAPTTPSLVYPTPTPRVLRALRNVVIAALLLFAVLTIAGTVAPELALGSARDDATYGMQLRNARATLAEADRRASVAFLDPATAAGSGEWTTYEATLDTVSSMLVRAAAQHPGDADRLATVQTQVNDYRRTVDAAWTKAATDATSGGTTYAATSAKLTDPLATLAALAQESDARLGGGPLWMAGYGAVIAGWLALVALAVSSVVIARRTRRVLNIGLVLAVVLVGVALSLASTANGLVQQSLIDVRTTTLVQARSHADTRALAEQAKATEDRNILTGSPSTTAWDALSTSVTSAIDALPDQDQRKKQAGLWTAYTAAHKALPPSASANATANAAARAQARGTALSTVTSFVQSAEGLSDSSATTATDSLSTVKSQQLPYGIVASILALLSIIAALAGITRRLTEYV